MKILKCEMCGCTDFKEQSNFIVCNACGTHYSNEEKLDNNSIDEYLNDGEKHISKKKGLNVENIMRENSFWYR